MTQPFNTHGKALWPVILVILLVFIIGLGWKLLLQRKKSTDPVTAIDQTVSQTADKVRQPVTPEPVVDFETIGKSEVMAERKAALGIDESIDMVVTAGDTVKIGETTIPFNDILAKIRIKSGQIGESDLQKDGVSSEITLTKAEIDQLAADIQTELDDVEQQLSDAQLDPDVRSALTEKRNRLKQLSEAYNEHKNLNDALTVAQKRLKGVTEETGKKTIQQEIATLRQRLAGKKEVIITQVKAGNAIGAYGLHVVKPNDNIWNIHFQFLKSYFAKRGITVSPVADEPLRTGRSSGLGKLLKFSENMVHIYNLKTRQIDQDLHTIEPLSKIIVFNLGQVFALLNTLNYNQINRIDFDGETLWLPAES